MKIIIAGDGKVGLTLTQKLSAEGHDLTLIDSNQKVLDSSVERYDVMGGRVTVPPCGTALLCKRGTCMCRHELDLYESFGMSSFLYVGGNSEFLRCII